MQAALDEDFGAGFGTSLGSADATPLLEGVAIGTSSAGQGSAYERREAAAAPARTTRTGATEIELTDEDLVALAPASKLPLPDALALKAVILGSPEDLAGGSYRLFVENAVGPSGARWLGRFCHLDASIHEAVREHLREEEALRPDAIFAEVVHLPQGRLGFTEIPGKPLPTDPQELVKVFMEDAMPD